MARALLGRAVLGSEILGSVVLAGDDTPIEDNSVWILLEDAIEADTLLTTIVIEVEEESKAVTVTDFVTESKAVVT